MIRAPSRIKWTAGWGAPQISTYLRGTLNATSCSEHPEEFHIKKNSYSVLYKGCVLVPETLQSILENQCFFHSQVTITQTIPNSLSHTYKTPIHNAWDKACQLMLLWTPSTIPELWTHELHSVTSQMLEEMAGQTDWMHRSFFTAAASVHCKVVRLTYSTKLSSTCLSSQNPEGQYGE